MSQKKTKCFHCVHTSVQINNMRPIINLKKKSVLHCGLKKHVFFQILRDEEQRSDYDYMLDNPGETKAEVLDWSIVKVIIIRVKHKRLITSKSLADFMTQAIVFNLNKRYLG